MRKATGLLAFCGVALAAGVIAAADTPTTILDTYGDGSRWGIGATRTAGGSLGYDPSGANGSNLVPSDPTKAAYAILPFSVTSLPAGQSYLSSVEIVFNAQAGADVSSHLDQLTGAIFEAPAGATSLTGDGVTQVGQPFTFDTSTSRDMIFTNLGSGIGQLIGALDLSKAGVTFSPGKAYFLVLEPKIGLHPTTCDTLVDYGIWNARAASDVTGSGAVLSNSYTTVAQAQDTALTLTPGDSATLQPIKIGTRGPVPGYFGARISVAEQVGGIVTGHLGIDAVSDLFNTMVPLGAFTFDFRTPGTTDVVYTADVYLAPKPGDTSALYTFGGVPAGTYDIAIKGPNSLRIVLSSITVGAGLTTLDDQLLMSGDADNSNSVDVGDFGTLVNFYGTDCTIPGSGYDPAPDFNFDGSIDITDFGTLVNNYGATGG